MRVSGTKPLNATKYVIMIDVTARLNFRVLQAVAWKHFCKRHKLIIIIIIIIIIIHSTEKESYLLGCSHIMHKYIQFRGQEALYKK